MTLNTNHHFPRHSHDQFTVGVIDSGAQRSWSRLGTVYASAGDVIAANPGEIHGGVPIDRTPRRLRMIYLDPWLVYREMEQEGINAVEILPPVVRDPILTGTFTRLFTYLTDVNSDHLGTEESLLRCLIRLLRKHRTARPSMHSCTPRIAKAVLCLNASPEKAISLTELAALCGVSRFQLLRAFAREMGITPHAYLIQRRVLLARRLLACGQTSAEAATQAGFADQSHMTRAFVRQMGITPSRYRALTA
ncbi:MAG TPA: AraC family transcriptional regulator [Candidatus Udaeobacter sp.]|nr:AraC family transcriptional regulator [Candidatus Udaeobacter sp.]